MRMGGGGYLGMWGNGGGGAGGMGGAVQGEWGGGVYCIKHHAGAAYLISFMMQSVTAYRDTEASGIIRCKTLRNIWQIIDTQGQKFMFLCCSLPLLSPYTITADHRLALFL